MSRPIPATAAWTPAPSRPRLSLNEVHVWRTRLDPDPEEPTEPVPTIDPIPSALSPDERARAARFRFARDRHRYITSRVMLRTTLARYLDCPPEAIQFMHGPQGKPSLASPAAPLQFNLSHSEGLMLLAVAQDREVGVDVESIHRKVSFEAVAERYFPLADAREITALPLAHRARKFFEIWTSIEARLKALGTGLGGDWAAADCGRWSMRHLFPADGFTAALAVEGPDFQLECWSWPS